ncbi:hypothetical protein K501DRAFT_332465 [Backusella circina FSU 941]|nr:hypothetical protein K501DRAFT_332465 [Backusella circina FSU 941]
MITLYLMHTFIKQLIMSLDTATLSTQSTTSSALTKQQSKLLLRSALQKANEAVQHDSTNNVMGAISSYTEAISLLDRVLVCVEKENDRRRLQEIHDSYSERIRLLSKITSKLGADSLNLHTLDDESKAWLSKPNKRGHNNARPHIKTAAHQSYSSMIRRMTSSSSIESALSDRETSKVQSSFSSSANHTLPPSSIRSDSLSAIQQKETQKLPTLPPPPSSPTPIPPLQTSKSTPIKTSFNNPNTEDANKKKEQDKNEHQEEADTPRPSPPRLSSRANLDLKDEEEHQNGDESQDNSVRNSLDSFDSTTSSIELSENMVPKQQPVLNLPLLKKEQTQTPIPDVKSKFRSRTSSLPKMPAIQRSTSMTAVENVGSPEIETLEDGTIPMRRNNTVPIPESESDLQDFSDTSSVTTMASTITQSTFATATIVRPVIARPAAGLGSIRRKAANRLSRSSMDGPSRKDKSSAVFSLFLKDSPKQDADMDYIGDNHTQMMDQQDPSLDANVSNIKPGTEFDSSPLKLLLSLEKSMIEGGYITQRLYIPKNLWQQPNIRLSSMEIKVTACESLINDISKLESWSYLDDVVSSTKLLENFESSLDMLQTLLSKKLKRESMDSSHASTSQNGFPSNRDSNLPSINRMDSSGSKKTQSFMSWGTKFTKSVERMNAFSLTKTEDQFKAYIESLQKLFIKIHVLEKWLQYYQQENKKEYDLILMKLTRVCGTVNTAIGGFVVRDITVILAKWLKRGSSWVNE